jgi:hypothetical protein
MRDILGNEYNENQTIILKDPWFEVWLKRFDPNLRLVFDQGRRKWIILEWSPPAGAYNILLVCEDKDGNPKGLGDWVKNKLIVWRNNYEVKKRQGVDQWMNALNKEALRQKEEIDQRCSKEMQYIINDERLGFRKAYREMRNEPISDVTAGYRK